MTKQELNDIRTSEGYLKIEYDNNRNHGIIYIKKKLYSIRKKKLDKLLKGYDVNISEANYNDVFMSHVLILFKKLRNRDNWYKQRGYIKVYTDTGYKFVERSHL